MEPKTRVRSISIKPKREEEPKITEPVELEKPTSDWPFFSWRGDELIRNFAVVGALLLTLLALKNSGSPEAVSVFSALQEGVGMEWDESVGKLSFVNRLLPEELQAVWSEEKTADVYAPINGTTVHAWNENEPYVTIRAYTKDVRAAAGGEVMSIAHGLDEERILRIRHADDTEALYGNLATCYAKVGDWVETGDVIATVMDGYDLAFEWREDGRSVDPSTSWKSFVE